MNVVLICLDTFRADCIGALNRNPVIQTPNMGRLAREGVLFENAFGCAQPTLQHRITMCTGMRAFPFVRDYDTRGLWPISPGWHKIPPEWPTLAELLLENGFATGLASDTFHMFKPTVNYTRGMGSWDFIRGQEDDNYRSGPMSAIHPERFTPPGRKPGAMAIQYLLNVQGRRGEEDWLPAKVFSSAIRFLEDNRDNRPFFLWVDSFDPHEPWDPPRAYADLYAPDWDENWEPILDVGPERNEKAIRRHVALYYGEITFVDKQIGRLLAALEDLRLADDTLVVLTSDHGTELMDHGSFRKGVHRNHYRHNHEVACSLRFPGREHAGKRVMGLIQSCDLFPTLIGLLGVRGPAVEGMDFMPLVRGETESLRDFIVSGWSGYGQAPTTASVRTLESAYSCDYMRLDLNEHLFDLAADAGETRNLAAERPDVAAEYRARLEEFLGERLPAKPCEKTRPSPPPAAVWWQKADWARRMRKV
ncbi:MAG: sulfatase [Candidatus Sumerlaeota bacterium]|nr:sulfatase [Candidatus Sumerlaeota bacterium]